MEYTSNTITIKYFIVITISVHSYEYFSSKTFFFRCDITIGFSVINRI